MKGQVATEKHEMDGRLLHQLVTLDLNTIDQNLSCKEKFDEIWQSPSIR